MAWIWGSRDLEMGCEGESVTEDDERERVDSVLESMWVMVGEVKEMQLASLSMRRG